MGGFDLTITIPAVRVTLTDGNAIKAQLTGGTLVNGIIGIDPSVHAGSDATGHALLYTPVVVARRLDDLALGHGGLPEPADGTVHQR